MKECSYICKCISKENGCVQESSLQMLTFIRLDLLGSTVYLFFHPLKTVFFLLKKLIYHQSNMLT